MFFKRQVFLNVVPGSNRVPSGTVTSAMNCAQSHTFAAEAPDGNIAAGKSDNTSAQSNNTDAALKRSFIGASSVYIQSMTTLKPPQKFHNDYAPPIVYLLFKDCSISRA